MDESSAQIVTWLLVVGGWFLVDHKNSKREEKKARRLITDEVIKSLKNIETESMSYHTCAEPDKIMSQKIKRDIQLLINRINRLELCGNKKLLMHFRQSVTLKNFDTNTFQTQEPNSRLVNEIYEACDDLIEEIENIVHKKNGGLFCG